MIKHMLIAVIVMLMSSGSMALTDKSSCNMSHTGLPPDVALTMTSQCEQLKAQQATSSDLVYDTDIVTVEDLVEWSEVAQEFSKAIGLAAKEAGTAVNEFIHTPLGIITVCVVLWYVFGAQIIGIPMLLAGWIVAYLYIRAIMTDSYEVKTIKRLWFEKTIFVRVPRVWKNMDQGSYIGLVLSLGVLAAWTAVMFAIIF